VRPLIAALLPRPLPAPGAHARAELDRRVRDTAEPSWIWVALAAILLVAVAIFARENLPYAGFWYD
jgi:hypothetical protein